jgi:hypothetical protein
MKQAGEQILSMFCFFFVKPSTLRKVASVKKENFFSINEKKFGCNQPGKKFHFNFFFEELKK